MPFTKGHKFYKGGEKGWFKKGHKLRVGIKHTKETILKIIDSRKGKCLGENNASWKGGTTPLMNKIKRLTEYKQWQIKVLKRDKYICRKCGSNKGNKSPHHLTALSFLVNMFNIKKVADAKECVDLFNVRNGITLCIDCHYKTPNFAWKAVKTPRDKTIY